MLTTSYLKQRNLGLSISPTDLLIVKKEIGEEKDNSKKVAKSSKDQTDVDPKTKAKRKLVIQQSDSKWNPSTKPVKKAKTLKTNTVVVLGVLPSLFSSKPIETVVVMSAVPVSFVQSQIE